MDYKNTLYFNTIRTYVVSILDSFNDIKYWKKDEDGNDIEKIIPIKFGNYEKSIMLEDITKEQYKSGNFNFLPRLVLSFEGMSKADRDTNKFRKYSQRITDTEGKPFIQYAYNSVSYDFNFNLTLQARGLNEAFMIVEEILPFFRPSYTIDILEYPLFPELTTTQLLISDPEFDIINEFEETDVNIITITFPLTLRGNLYMPIQLQAPIEKVKMFNLLWNTRNIYESKVASYYEFDVNPFTHKIYNTAKEMHFAPRSNYIDTPEDVSNDMDNMIKSVFGKSYKEYVEALKARESRIKLIVESQEEELTYTEIATEEPTKDVLVGDDGTKSIVTEFDNDYIVTERPE
jgi:hypothetical protein